MSAARACAAGQGLLLLGHYEAAGAIALLKGNNSRTSTETGDGQRMGRWVFVCIWVCVCVCFCTTSMEMRRVSSISVLPVCAS